jgi:hypothetical protein
MTLVGLVTIVPAARPISGDERFWGAVIAVAAAFVFSGFWMPWFAEWRVNRIKPDRANDADGKRREKRKQEYWRKLSKRGSLSVLMGKDGRLSSSKSVAYAWTVLVVYVLAVLIITWPPDWSAALKNLSPTYLLLLGGPYASLVLSKGIVSSRTASGSLTKSTGDGTARLTDLIADDNARVDLFDVQFVLFNAIAIWFVIKAFGQVTTGGFPEIPSELVLLTGGPAAVYLSNKLYSSTSATISSVTPSRVTEGEPFFVIGSGFLAGYVQGVSQESIGTVEVDGRSAPSDLVNWTDTRIRATAPRPSEGSKGPVRVTVTGPGDVTATLDGAITVEVRPVIEGFDREKATRGQQLCVIVDWPPGTPVGKPVALLANDILIPAGATTGPGHQTATVTVPSDLPLGQNGHLDLVIKGPGSDSVAKTIAIE